jgi:hypothetical protein
MPTTRWPTTCSERPRSNNDIERAQRSALVEVDKEPGRERERRDALHAHAEREHAMTPLWHVEADDRAAVMKGVRPHRRTVTERTASRIASLARSGDSTM